MAKGSTFAPFFQRLIEAPEAALSALRQDPTAFEAALLHEERGILRADAAIPAYGAVGAILFDGTGQRVALAGPDWLPDAASFDDLDRISVDLARSNLFKIERGTGPALLGVWAPLTETRSWNLPGPVAAASTALNEGRLALFAGAAVGEGPIDSACRSFGLTDLEQRVVSATIRTGSGRAAAVALALSYATVREAIANAQRRTQTQNLPSLTRAIVAAAFGVLPDEVDRAQVLADMLPLTERQARICVLIASGLSRDEVSRAVHTSKAVVKKDLETIFDTLGVGSATELARMMEETRALHLFARSTASAVGFYDPNTEPTRLLQRPDRGGTIAWSDYGPRSGRPVLIVHSNWSCRAVPRPLVAALHAAGFRPIAIDRPGFGMTGVGRSHAGDPFTQAVDDTVRILDLLKIDRIAVLARCGAQFVTILARQAPERVGRVVLVSPTPQTGDDGLRNGIVGVIKEAFYRSPRLIEFFFRIICAQITLRRTETLTRAIVKGCPPDEALLQDPQFLRDRLRAIRPLSTGNLVGAVLEEQIISHGGYDFGVLDTPEWTVVQGSADPHNSFEEVKRYWQRILPSARFVEISDGGRFMTASHPALLVSLLR